MPDLLSIRERHATLQSALAENTLAEADTDRVTALLNDIAEAARETSSIPDYLWLRHTMEQWRSAGPILGIEVEPPPPINVSDESVPENVAWQSGNLEGWLSLKAFGIWKQRALEWYCSRSLEQILDEYRRSVSARQAWEASQRDYHQAELYLVLDVLEGGTHLVHSLTSDCYAKLEGCWLREIKELKAYLSWVKRDGGHDEDARMDDYGQACHEIMDRFQNAKQKSPQSSFEPFQRYIEREYLDGDGTLAENRAGVADSVRRKGQRLAALMRVPEYQTRQAAQLQMKQFYENIGPAVLGSDKQKACRVMEALGLQRGFEDNEAIVDCFQMALAMCFLDPSLAL